MRARRSFAFLLVLTLASVSTCGAAVLVAVSRAESGAPTLRADGAAPAVPVPAPAGRSPSAPPAPPATITVNGRPIAAAGVATVAAALARARITVRPGHYLSVVHHRPLHSNGQPGGVSVDGHRATLHTRVHPGDRIVVHQGPSRIEPTETVLIHLPPAVPSALYVGDRPGLARVTRGTISHEIVSERVLRRARSGHLVRPGAVALTFDDGPSRHWTRAILDVLHRRHVNATFCMIGRQVAPYAGLVRRIVRDGNALCDHTWDHDLDLRIRPRGQQRLDIRQGWEAIRRATHGLRPDFFRAPGGNWSRSLERLAEAQGMRPLTWTVDPRDWARPGVHAIVRTVLAELRPGGVILMHDGGGNRAETFAALRILLHRLPKLGYRFVLPPQ